MVSVRTLSKRRCVRPPLGRRDDSVLAQCHERLEARKAKRAVAAAAAAPPVAPSVAPSDDGHSLSPAGRPPVPPFLAVEEEN
ncbi:hypothetical protein KEM55_008091 [Ascosphaera atra]|nr:hypothetical protein KEM55_008091 [Ascosphaera atra]